MRNRDQQIELIKEKEDCLIFPLIYGARLHLLRGRKHIERGCCNNL